MAGGLAQRGRGEGWGWAETVTQSGVSLGRGDRAERSWKDRGEPPVEDLGYLRQKNKTALPAPRSRGFYFFPSRAPFVWENSGAKPGRVGARKAQGAGSLALCAGPGRGCGRQAGPRTTLPLGSSRRGLPGKPVLSGTGGDERPQRASQPGSAMTGGRTEAPVS